MVATFTTSIGATIKVNDPVGGVGMISGSTSVNYTNPVNVYIQSEDGDTTHMYTITVKVGLSFSDVPEDAWYHDNVMDAANNGYVSGMGDGTFNPKGATTRAQFASMIAKAMAMTILWLVRPASRMCPPTSGMLALSLTASTTTSFPATTTAPSSLRRPSPVRRLLLS